MNISLILAIIVFIFYAHTLGYPWKHFDEQLFYNEILAPIPSSFTEYIKLIENFGLNNHFEASNVFYTSISNLRGTPFDTLFLLTLFLFFKKNVFYYHLFSLILHVINTFFLSLIVRKILLFDTYKSNLDFCKNEPYTRSGRVPLGGKGSEGYVVSNKQNRSPININLNIFSILLPLIWALHPVNVESILFATNIAALLTYSFCIFITNYYLKDSKKNPLLIFFLYLIPLFLSEHTITFPLILFSILLAFKIHHNKLTLINAIKNTFQETLPLILAMICFLIHFFSDITKTNLNTSNSQNLNLILERISLISPQVFIHSIKLILFPLHLTIDQTGNILFSNSLFSPYTIFCSMVLYGLIISQIACLLYLKNKTVFNIFITFTPFIISLILYLNFISFSYCLFSERYLYFSTFFLVLGLANIFANIQNKKLQTIFLISCSLYLVLLGTRAYIRTLDWKDSITLFTSAYKENKNPLLKALRLQFAGSLLLSNNIEDIQLLGKSYIEESKSILNNYHQYLGKNKTNTPEIIKFYGLDNESLKLKTSYLLAFEQYGLENNKKEAYETLKKDIDSLKLKDSSIVTFYVNLANELNYKEINSVEILKSSLKENLNLNTLQTLANIYMQKQDYKNTQKHLDTAYKYFPYDIKTLSMQYELNQKTGNSKDSRFYKKLLNLRTHND